MSKLREGYKQTKVGVIPEEWEVVKLGDVFEKSFYGTSKATYDKGKYPVLRMGNMQQGSLIYDNLVYIDLDEKEFRKLQLQQGDILLNRTNSYDLVGKISLFNHTDIFITASYIVAYRPNKEKVCSIFINNILNTSYFQDRIKAIATKGVSQANINPTAFKNVIKIPLPPLKEQQKIAQIFTTWDDAISKQEALIEAKEQLKKGLMQKLLSGEVRFDIIGAATSVAEDNATKVASPEWEEVRLGDIAFKKSSSVSANSIENNSGNYVIYGASGVLKKIDFYIEKDPYISIVKDGAGVGRVYLCNSYSSVLGTMDIIKPKSSVDLYFLYSLLQQFNFMKYTTGSTIPHIYFKDYSKIKIKLPPKQEQQKIAQVLTTADKEITLLKEELEALKKQKRGLMQKLLSGEIRTINIKEK